MYKIGGNAARIALLGALLILLTMPSIALGKPAYLSIDPGSGSTNVVAQNMATKEATVVVSYAEQSGNPAASVSGVIPLRGAMEVVSGDVTELPSPWIGSMTLYSDAGLATVAITQWTGGSKGDGMVAGAYTGYAQGSDSTFLPYVQYTPGVREPLISVQNTGTGPATISMTYINKDGDTDFALTGIGIPLEGQKTFDMSGSGEGVPVWTDSAFFNQNGSWTGGVLIEAGADESIAVVITTHWRAYSFMNGSTSQGSGKLFATSVARRIVDGKVKEISYLAVQNMTGGNISITVDFYDQATQSNDHTMNADLGPYEVFFQNTRWLTELDREPGDPDRDIWVGSATVTAVGGDIAGTATTLRKEANTSSQYTTLGPSDGGTEIFFPAAYRIYSGSKPQQWTLLRLQNVTGSDATDVDIHFYDRDGNEVSNILDQTILANQSLGLNFKTQTSLGSDFVGSIYVTSDQDLVGAMDILWGNDQLASYNAVSQ
jgi:hypothetical protein